MPADRFEVFFLLRVDFKVIPQVDRIFKKLSKLFSAEPPLKNRLKAYPSA